MTPKKPRSPRKKKLRRPSRTKKPIRSSRTKKPIRPSRTKKPIRGSNRTKQIINILSAQHGLRDVKRRRRSSRRGKEYIRRWLTSRRVS